MPVTTLFEVSRNVFNFKMEVVTETMYRNGNDTNDTLKAFKQFFYYIARENALADIDNILVFRSEKRFRQSTIIRYQNLDPQMRARNFFFLLDNYFLQLHVSGSTDHTQNVIFNNIVETDLYRRFNTVVFDFMTGTNGTIERMLAQTPLALLLTENESRLGTVRSMSYRRSLNRIMAMVTNTQSALYSSNYASPEETSWRMLFHNRDDSAYDGMSASAADSPPSGSTLLQIVTSYRSTNFTSTRGEFTQGGEWGNVEPTKLMELVMFAFIEHEIIPPMKGSYTCELANFFSVLMSDPIQQIFTRHIKLLYRRGWRKDSLARKACFVFAEQYVGLVMMVVQQALLQEDCTLSTTPSFASNVHQFLPLTKIQDVLRSLLLAFDPVSYLLEEAVNREVHEKKFEYHFRQYTKYVSEIVSSYELWMNGTVHGVFNTGLDMRRDELFLRIIGAGGYEEARNNYLNGIAAIAAESDEATQSVQTNNQSTQFDDTTSEEMSRIEVKVKNTGTVPMSGPAALNRSPIVITDDPANNTTNVMVDAAHPTVNSMTNEQIMQAVSAAIKNELDMFVQKVVVPERNENASSSTKSFVAYASSLDYAGGGGGSELPESDISQQHSNVTTQLYDVEPSDSASQTGGHQQPPSKSETVVSSVAYFSDSTTVDDGSLYNTATTIDYNEPNQLIMTDDTGTNLRQMTQSETRVNIKEPQLVTVDNTDINTVLDDGTVGDLVLNEVDVQDDDGGLLPDDLQRRLDLTFGSETSGSSGHIFMDEVPSESAVPSRTLSTQQKNKYSASDDIRRNNFNNITARIAKVAGKADRELAQFRNRLNRQGEKTKRATLNRHVTANINRGLLKVDPSTESFKEEKKEKLKEEMETAINSVKIMEKKNKERVTKSLHKIKKVVLKKSAAVVKQKKSTVKTKPNKMVAIVKSTTKEKEVAQLNRRKRRLVEEQTQYKVNIRKQKTVKKKKTTSATNVQDVQDVNARLRQIENLQRNMPERLVLKPLGDNSSFVTGGKFNLSTYDGAGGIRSDDDDIADEE